MHSENWTLESRMHVNVHVRFGGGLMEKSHGYEPEGTVTVELSKAVVLVIDSVLERWASSAYGTCISLDNDADWHAFSILAWTLEKELSQLGFLSSSHRDLLETAQQSLTEYLGPARRGQSPGSST